MGNIRGWGGPLPDNWFKMRRALQHKILGRMQLLGMTPVLPCFAGHVPAELSKAFPAMNVSRSQVRGPCNIRREGRAIPCNIRRSLVILEGREGIPL